MEQESDFNRNRRDSSRTKDRAAHEARRTHHQAIGFLFKRHLQLKKRHCGLTTSTFLESTSDWRSRGRCYRPYTQGKKDWKDAPKHT